MDRRAVLAAIAASMSGCLEFSETSPRTQTSSSDGSVTTSTVSEPITQEAPPTTPTTTPTQDSVETASQQPSTDSPTVSLEQTWRPITILPEETPRYFRTSDGILYGFGSSIIVIDPSEPAVTKRDSFDGNINTRSMSDPICVDGETGYIGTISTTDEAAAIHRIDLEGGTVGWSHDVIKSSVTGIAVHDDRVFVASEDYSDTISSGFEVLTDGAVTDSETWESSISHVAYHDNTVYLGHGHDASTSLAYDIDTRSIFDVSERHEFGFNHLFTLTDETLFSAGRNLRAANLRTNEEILMAEIQGYATAAVAVDGEMVVVPTNQGVRGFDMRSGEYSWHVSIGDPFNRSPVINGNLAFLGEETVLYGINVETGAVVIEKELDSNIRDIAVVDDQLFVASNGIEAYTIEGN